MSMRYTKKRWLERLEASELPDPVKVTGRLFADAVGNRAGWRPYFEAAYAQERSVDVLGHLHRIARQNLAVHEQGHFLPILGPPVPRTGEYRLPAQQLELIDTMLRRFGGRSLYCIVTHGYIDQRSKVRWLLKATSPVNGKWPATRAVASSIVRPLLRRGLIQSNGCNWGGPGNALELSVNCFRLYAIAGLPKRLRGYVRAEETGT